MKCEEPELTRWWKQYNDSLISCFARTIQVWQDGPDRWHLLYTVLHVSIFFNTFLTTNDVIDFSSTANFQSLISASSAKDNSYTSYPSDTSEWYSYWSLHMLYHEQTRFPASEIQDSVAPHYRFQGNNRFWTYSTRWSQQCEWNVQKCQ